MSLINDALSDLDKRGQLAKVSDLPVEDRALGGPERSQVAESLLIAYRWPVFVLFCVLLLALLFRANFPVAISVNFPGSVAPVLVEANTGAKPELAIKANTALTSNVKAGAVNTDMAKVQQASPKPIPPQTISFKTNSLNTEQANTAMANAITKPEAVGEFAVLIEQAELALKNNRLTYPVGNNAYYFYQQALALNPGASQALQGVDKIKVHYLALIEREWRKGKSERVEQYISRVSPLLGEDEKPDFYNKITHIKQLNQSEKLAQAPVQVRGQERAQVKSDFSMLNTTSSQAPRENEVVNTADIQLSEQQWQKNTLDEAELFAEQGQPEQVLNLLLPLTGLTAEIERQRVSLLLDAYLLQEKYTIALALLGTVDNPSGTHIYQQAKILQHTAGDEQALALLDKQSRLSRRSMAMYAALLQKYKRFYDAEAVYRKLIKQAPSKSVYWLGLAVATDAQNNSTSAFSAYQQAQRLGGHSERVQLFIEQRMKALQVEKAPALELSQW